MSLTDRIEAALSAADKVADLASSLNEGIENVEMSKAIRAYIKSARGLDLRKFVERRDPAA